MMTDFESMNDNDVQDGVKSEENVSAWRRDPELSFSDWTIRVIQSSDDECFDEDSVADSSNQSNGNDIREMSTLPSNDDSVSSSAAEKSYSCRPELSPSSPTTYHVHRVFLASGKRKSEYFETLFSLANDTEESLSRTTELVLPESACLVFPRLLDYIYEGGRWTKSPDVYDFPKYSPDWNGDSETYRLPDACKEDVALAFLADYLRVGVLIPQIKRKLGCTLNDSNIHVVCREALMYSIDWIVHSCIKIAARSPHDLLSIPNNEDQATAASAPPALQIMRMLPLEQQNELWKRSLQSSLDELRRFKRVPSQWKSNIDDVVATHMPTLVIRRDHRDPTAEDYRLPRQGCGLPFPNNKLCPLFYFDRERKESQPAPPPPPPDAPPLQDAPPLHDGYFEDFDRFSSETSSDRPVRRGRDPDR